MNFFETPLAGAYEIELTPFIDDRGVFARTFCRKEFARIGFQKKILQINQSKTFKKGVIRGLHYQLPPAAEVKIVRSVRGRVFDVMVDLRYGSPTFLQWHSVELSEDNMKSVLIPEGLAHGFQSISEHVELMYFSSSFYSPEYERGLRYDDPALSIKWPLPVSIVSQKDQDSPLIDSYFMGIEL